MLIDISSGDERQTGPIGEACVTNESMWILLYFASVHLHSVFRRLHDMPATVKDPQRWLYTWPSCRGLFQLISSQLRLPCPLLRHSVGKTNIIKFKVTSNWCLYIILRSAWTNSCISQNQNIPYKKYAHNSFVSFTLALTIPHSFHAEQQHTRSIVSTKNDSTTPLKVTFNGRALSIPRDCHTTHHHPEQCARIQLTGLEY